jgi:hypothetical protein
MTVNIGKENRMVIKKIKPGLMEGLIDCCEKRDQMEAQKQYFKEYVGYGCEKEKIKKENGSHRSMYRRFDRHRMVGVLRVRV